MAKLISPLWLFSLCLHTRRRYSRYLLFYHNFHKLSPIHSTAIFISVTGQLVFSFKFSPVQTPTNISINLLLMDVHFQILHHKPASCAFIRNHNNMNKTQSKNKHAAHQSRGGSNEYTTHKLCFGA